MVLQMGSIFLHVRSLFLMRIFLLLFLQDCGVEHDVSPLFVHIPLILKKKMFSFQKLDPKKPVKPKDAKVFDYFPHGIACHSNFLPEYIQKIKKLLKRKSEIERNYCFVECPAPPKEKV